MKNWMLVAAGTAVWLAACSDRTLAPRANAPGVGPSFSTGGPTACPAAADFVVTTEGELAAALAAASPGATIALNGMIGVTADVNVTTPNVTLTCATPGSGIFATPGATIVEMVNAGANGVVVDRLVLDASATDGDPYFALGVAGVRLTNNSVKCSSGSCAFLPSASGAIITDNHFESAGSFTGVHMQTGIDGSRVERNTIVTSAPTFQFGGIRVRDGSNVVVADNVVQGPWANSIATTNLTGSHFENNRLEGAGLNGIRVTFFPSVAMIDNVFRNNRVTGAASAGIFAQLACRNTFVGNNLNGNANDVGLFFALTTGANTFVGNKNVVVDNGDFDCDGDGIADPNIITGPGKEQHGLRLGPPAGDPLGNGRLQ